MYIREMVIHYIYKIHFLCGFPAGRYYIGKHTHRGKDLSNDKYTGSGNFCYSYFRKYGKKEGVTYIKEILEINPSAKINNDREIYHIGNLWETDKLCMNQCPGGGPPPNRIQVYKYDLLGQYIGEYNSASEAAYDNDTSVRSVLLCCNVKLGSAGGYVWRYYKKDKIDVDFSKLQSKPVSQYTKKGIFVKTYKSIKDAVEENGFKDSSSIGACCMRKRNSAHGFIWRYLGDKDINTNLKFAGNRKINQYDLDGNYIKTFNTLKDAGMEIGVPWQAIQRVCNGKRKTSHGYIWKYADEV